MKKQISIIIRILIFLLFIALVSVGLYFYNNNLDYNVPSFGEIIESVKTIPREVITPSPLHGPTNQIATSNLTVAGIITETNMHRLQYGLEPLSSDFALDNAAEMKVDDMFARQYFAHESPTGEGPSDLADAAGYDFLIIGENLALGNYENDTILVQAWMDSPGHRANILNAKFTEIGVAVKKDIYEGNLVWIAVQEFGRPVSDCPSVNESLLAQIDENEQLLKDWAEELDRKRRSLERRPGRSPEYTREMDEYNELVDQYNKLLKDTQYLVNEYNNQVADHNLCIQ